MPSQQFCANNFPLSSWWSFVFVSEATRALDWFPRGCLPACLMIVFSQQLSSLEAVLFRLWVCEVLHWSICEPKSVLAGKPTIARWQLLVTRKPWGSCLLQKIQMRVCYRIFWPMWLMWARQRWRSLCFSTFDLIWPTYVWFPQFVAPDFIN